MGQQGAESPSRSMAPVWWRPADIEKLKYLRLNMNNPSMRPSPVLHLDQLGSARRRVRGEIRPRQRGLQSGMQSSAANALLMNGPSAFEDKPVNHIEKCVSASTFGYKADIPAPVGMFWPTRQNYCAPCKLLGRDFPARTFLTPILKPRAK